MKKRTWNFLSKFNYFIPILITIPAILPLFNKGFFITDDAEWMIIRFSAFHQALRGGEFPVRFLGRLNQEYGYPVTNFLYPGFMYLAEPFRIIGFGYVDSIKIILALSIVLSGLFTYFWLRVFFDRLSSQLGALLYIYTPYHLYDLYKRGSVGELLAIAILPFIFWQIERESLFWSALGIGLLILAHNTLAILFLGVIICYMLLNIFLKKKKQLFFKYISMILIGMGLSAFFWIPALFELQYTVFSKTIVSDWRGYFASVSLVGYPILVVLFIVIFNFKKKQIVTGKFYLTMLLFIICLTSIALSTPISFQLWNILPGSLIQFPFRFLSVTLICIAFLAAISITAWNGRWKYFISTGIVIIVIASILPYLKPDKIIDKEEGYYTTNMATTTVMDEYLPNWVKVKPLKIPDNKVEILNGKGTVRNLIYNSNKLTFDLNLKSKSQIRINTIYFPGWKVSVDDKSAPLSINNIHGVMEFPVPTGEHSVRAEFGETELRLFSDVVSLISFISLIVIAFYYVINQRSKIKN